MKIQARMLLLSGVFVAVCNLAQAQVTSPASTEQTPKSGVPANNKPVLTIGGDVHAPMLVEQVDPEYSQDAREKKISGDVKLGLIVDENGVPQKVHVVYGIGYGLDEQAIAAVEQYRFKPAMKGDVPVAVKMYIAVRFRIFSKQP